MVNSLLFVLLFLGAFSHLDTLEKEEEFHSILQVKKTYSLYDSFDYTIIEEKHIKVLDEDGLDQTFTSLFYDKLIQVKDFQLDVIDPETGKTIEKARLRDMTDVAIISNTSIFEDNRRKYYRLKTRKYPVEVKVRTETYHKTNYYFPAWNPVDFLHQKVTEATLEIIYPYSVGIRFKEQNLQGQKVQEKTKDGRERITWEEFDFPILDTDFDKKSLRQILIAPHLFSMEGHEGSMEDWNGFAAWQFELNKGRGELPEEFKSEILTLVEGIDDPYEKVSLLYDFLQQNFRYVSIQLGIGGWQTMTAGDVVKYSYGDCKGLTNLMKSMLEVVGIPSNYTLVYAGVDVDDIELDLPSNQFNHVILQVPTENNPIWLECTSNLLPAGFLGEFTKNRHVLVIQEGGGYLTKTPAYNFDTWNKVLGKSTVEIDAQGNANINAIRQMEGNFAEEMMMLKHSLDERSQRDYFHKNSPVSGLIIRDFLLEVTKKDSIPIVNLEFSGQISRFGQATAKRLILKPFLEKITEDMLSNASLNLEESYEITLPDGLEAEVDLEDTQIEDKDFQFTLTNKFSEGKLLIERKIKLNLPEKLEIESMKELLKTLNQAGSRSYYFIKSSSFSN